MHDSPELSTPSASGSISPAAHTAPTQEVVQSSPSLRFMFKHPAHLVALGFGSGLSRVAPGTFGTLWAWVSFLALAPWLNDVAWGVVLALALALGWWTCSVTARHLGVRDPACIVWDEIVAFWLILWLISPTSLEGQAIAFTLFRFFDAVKPGPVGWADALFHEPSPTPGTWTWQRASLGILWDDLVAAACTLLLIAVWRYHTY